MEKDPLDKNEIQIHIQPPSPAFKTTGSVHRKPLPPQTYIIPPQPVPSPNPTTAPAPAPTPVLSREDIPSKEIFIAELDANPDLEPPCYACLASQTPYHKYPSQSQLPAGSHIHSHAHHNAAGQSAINTKEQKESFIYNYNAPLPPLPPRSSFFVRSKAKWNRLQKRTRYLILGALVAFLVFVIGLAAGLASRSNKFSNLPLPNSHGGPYAGDLTYYDPGLGACGITSSSSDFIVAVSHYIFDAVQTGSNPNANPLCGKKIRANRGGKSVDLTVVDRCVGCKPTDIDVTQTVFEGLANIDQGRVPVNWAWLEGVPGA